MTQFDTLDLDRTGLSKAARDAMLELILAWAHLDGAISIWVSVKFDLAADKTAILLGRADAPSKLLKLKRLYTLEGDALTATMIGALRREYEREVKPRNTVAHASCRGSLKSDPQLIVFASFEVVSLGQLAIDAVSIDLMQRSTAWAHEAANNIEAITNRISPLE